ncbi:MAG: hypothetical protein GJV46_09485 [Geobacter sp.]|nr:hypothetical protein [Geobacter sp.]
MRDLAYETHPVRNMLGKLLGRILVNGTWMSQQHLERALADQQNANDLLADVLHNMGVLDSADAKLAQAIRHHALPLSDAIRAASAVRQLLGNLLLSNGQITKEQLDLALQEQLRTGEKLGEVMVRLGFIEEKQRDAVLASQLKQQQAVPTPVAFRLGDILIAAGFITQEQLKDTLERQKHSTKKIGELLIEIGYAKQHQIEHGIRLQNVLVTAALGTVMALSAPDKALAASSGGGGRSSNTIQVSASVKAVALVKVLHQQPTVVVTSENIAQGYVEVPAASRIEVKNNNPSGYLLSFESQGGPFQEVLVKGLGTDLQISSGNGWMMMPHTRTPAALELTYRFILSADAQPGTYQWPFQISAMTL